MYIKESCLEIKIGGRNSRSGLDIK